MGGGVSMGVGVFSSKTPTDIADSLNVLGLSYKRYKESIISNGISGIFLDSISSPDEIDEVLKLLNIKSKLHKKVIKAHLLYLKRNGSLPSDNLNNGTSQLVLEINSNNIEDIIIKKKINSIESHDAELFMHEAEELSENKIQNNNNNNKNNTKSSSDIKNDYPLHVIKSLSKDSGDETVLKVLQALVQNFERKNPLESLNFGKVLASFNGSLYEYANETGKLTVDNIIAALSINRITIDKHQSMKIIRLINNPSANDTVTVISVMDYFLNQLRNNSDFRIINSRNTNTSTLKTTDISPLRASANGDNNKASLLRLKKLKKNLENIKLKEDDERKINESIELYQNRPATANASPKLKRSSSPQVQNVDITPINSIETNRASNLRWEKVQKKLANLKRKENNEKLLQESIDNYKNRPASANAKDYFFDQKSNNSDFRIINSRNTNTSTLKTTDISPLRASANGDNNKASLLRLKKLKKNLENIKLKEDDERKINESIELYQNRPATANASPKLKRSSSPQVQNVDITPINSIETNRASNLRWENVQKKLANLKRKEDNDKLLQESIDNYKNRPASANANSSSKLKSRKDLSKTANK